MIDRETRTIRRWQHLQEARSTVRPVVGELPMGLDNADDVYAAALEQMGVDEDIVDQLRDDRTAKVAYDAIISMKGNGAKRAQMARDSATTTRLAELFPHYNRLGRSY